MLSIDAAERIGISPGSPGVVATGAAEGIGQQQLVDTWIAPIAEFDIGGEQIQRTHVEIGHLHSRYENPDEHYDMLLGADFFLAHHVYVANSQSKLYFTYGGGPVFDVGPRRAAPARGSPAVANAMATDPSASSADLMRRGMAEESRGLLDQALADFTRACNLDSRDADCLYQRGMAHWRLRQGDPALQDFDTAIQISPHDYLARLARAELRLRQPDAAVTPGVDAAAVTPDLDAVDRLAPQADNARFTLAELYDDIDLYGQAVHEITVWIRYHSDDVQLGSALNFRCWYRAEANQDLDQALKDCNRALHLAPGSQQFLDSRGLVNMRLGKLDDAIGDYDAALKQNPKLASSLFGRGLAELRKGETAQGQADIAAAERTNPRVVGFFARFGLKP
jgi:tetratricopeptide (TPR) repeat protein